MSTNPSAGEVWVADLGVVAKSRPVLVLAVPNEHLARALVIVAPLTSQIRKTEGEVDIGKPRWLTKPSAVNVQGLASFDRHKVVHKLGTLASDDMKRVKAALRLLLDL